METATSTREPFAVYSKRIAQRLLIIGENRLELLAVELQEERERLLRSLLLALSVAAFGMLAGLTLTAAIVVCLWAWSPTAVLLILTALYGTSAIFLCRQLLGGLRDWQTFSASLHQLRKDRACLEKALV